MKKLILLLLIIITSCGTVKQVPVQSNTYTHVIDSIAWHDSTIITYIDKERVVDIVKTYDTLRLETDYAKAEAYVDSTFGVIRGTLENKDTVPIKTIIQWKERIVRDTLLTYKEVPVEVEVVKTKTPTWAWYTLGFCIIAIVVLTIKIYLKFHI